MRLILKKKSFSVHSEIDIIDEGGTAYYHCETKFPSLTHQTVITNAEGNEIASVHSKAISSKVAYYVTMNDGPEITIGELAYTAKDGIEIPSFDWEVVKDPSREVCFQIKTRKGDSVAVIAKRNIDDGEVFTADIEDENQADRCATALLVLNLVHSDLKTVDSLNEALGTGSKDEKSGSDSLADSIGDALDNLINSSDNDN